MSVVYEDENKVVNVALAENDYIKVTTTKANVWLKITNENGKLCVENIEDTSENKQ